MSNTSRAETKLKKDSKKSKKEEIGKLSPTHSEIEEPITFKPIDGEDIQALLIKEDELKRLKKSRLGSEKKLTDILVRKKNKNAYPTKEIKVAKLVPDRQLKPIDYSESQGIHFDGRGNCMPHSILGTVEEYLRESERHGNSVEFPPESMESDIPKADSYLKPTKEKNTNLENDNGYNALENWRQKMIERKMVQNSISKSLNRPLDDLVMNQADSARRFNEIKTLIDRTLPLVEQGKGSRLGSEFWNQPFQIGSADNGLFTTLTESEKGNIPVLEQILKPSITIKETDFKENQPAVVHYPWDRSEYLQKRLNDLEPMIKEIIPHRPEFAQLQVIGKSCEDEHKSGSKNELRPSPKNYSVNDTWVNPKVYDPDNQEKNEEYEEHVHNHYLIETGEDPFSNHPDVIQGPIFGPAIVFGGQTAKWTGGEDENKGIIALESRLNFETKAGKRVLATFEIYNTGTTAIYYDWKKIKLAFVKTEEFNPFEIASNKSQRFYFDTRSSVILPGDFLKLHVVFKSSKGGIFTEKWEFVTQPSLLSSASLVLTLRGVAVQEDKHKKNRAAIERKLLNKEAELIATSMLDFILSGVRTPERCQSPQNAYLTEEDLFNQLNPDFYYDHDTIIEIKSLYDELYDDKPDKSEWDLSINNLKFEIMGLEELDPNKQDYLARLNNLLTNMCFPTYSPNYSKLYSICYNMLCQSIDVIGSELSAIKKIYSMPNDANDDFPNVDEFKVRYEQWKKENELFKQAEIEKKNRLESLKGKDSKEKNAGKLTAGKKDDKKKDEKKKSTPTPSAKNPRQTTVTSRSASRNNQDKIEERSRTPKNGNATILSEEEYKSKNMFEDKAYLNVYQELSRLIDNMDGIFSEIMKDTDVEERLSTLVFESSAPTVPMNSDYID